MSHCLTGHVNTHVVSVCYKLGSLSGHRDSTAARTERTAKWWILPVPDGMPGRLNGISSTQPACIDVKGPLELNLLLARPKIIVRHYTSKTSSFARKKLYQMPRVSCLIRAEGCGLRETSCPWNDTNLSKVEQRKVRKDQLLCIESCSSCSRSLQIFATFAGSVAHENLRMSLLPRRPELSTCKMNRYKPYT